METQLTLVAINENLVEISGKLVGNQWKINGNCTAPVQRFYSVCTASEEHVNKIKYHLIEKPFPKNTNIWENQAIQREIGYSLIVELMKPNLIFDRETTERRQQARLDRVPRNKGIILENERVVEAIKRITEDDLEKLYSLSVAWV